MRKLSVLIALVAVAVAIPAVAPGKGNPGVIRSGKCSGGATWKLKAKNDDARLEIEFEVDQNVSGRRWNVVINRGSRVIFRGARTTAPPSGSFTVRRLPANPAGSDRITATARSAAGNQVCRGALTV
jgi:hypothetical protein